MAVQLNIDYDRGVTKRKHKATGIDVYMYDDEPGVFRTAHGNIIAVKFAKEAGFDIASLEKERVKKERVAQAMSAIEAEFSSHGAVREVLKEKDGLRVVHIGAGRHNVEDPDGGVLNQVHLSKEVALKLLDSLAPSAEEVPAA